MTAHLDRIAQLVANNALWIHEAVSALEMPGTFTPILWQNPHDMPPIFPNADVLGGTEAEQLAAIAALVQVRSGRVTAVKDAWARLDLTPLGFEPLFEAQWLYRDAGPLQIPPTDLQFEFVQTPAALREFSVACNGADLAAVYSPILLDHAHIRWILARRQGQIAGGVTAVHAEGVNGVNNLFASSPQDQASLICAAVNAFAPGPACSYARGDSIAPFLSLGFEAVGKLRVWVRHP
jgi:hypothetical protein